MKDVKRIFFIFTLIVLICLSINSIYAEELSENSSNICFNSDLSDLEISESIDINEISREKNSNIVDDSVNNEKYIGADFDYNENIGNSEQLYCDDLIDEKGSFSKKLSSSDKISTQLIIFNRSLNTIPGPNHRTGENLLNFTILDEDGDLVTEGSFRLTFPNNNGVTSLNIQGHSNGVYQCGLSMPSVPGNYVGLLEYLGSNRFDGSYAYFVVYLEDLSDKWRSYTTISEVNGYSNSQKTLQANIVDANGNPIDGGYVDFIFNGNTYTANVTNGVAYKTITLPSIGGSYFYIAEFYGHNIRNPSRDINFINVNVSSSSSSSSSGNSSSGSSGSGSSTNYAIVKTTSTEVWLQSSLANNCYILDSISKYPSSTVKFYIGISSFFDDEYGGKVTLKLNGKSYTAKVYNGVATIVAKTPSKAGSYKVTLTYSGHTYVFGSEGYKYKPSSSKFTLKVKKYPTVVTAPKVTAKYKKSKYFNVKIKNKVTKKLLKNFKIILKVYTGKKYTIYKIKTNSKGIAKLNTKKFKIGKHKVKISSSNKNYSISKTSYIVIKRK